MQDEHNNPDINVKCVADAPDFIPWWVHTEGCPRRVRHPWEWGRNLRQNQIAE